MQTVKKEEMVITSAVSRSEYAVAVRPLRGQWANVIFFGSWIGGFLFLFYQKLTGQHHHKGGDPKSLVFWCIGAALYAGVLYFLRQKRIASLFADRNAVIQIVTKLTHDGFSQKLGDQTNFVAWKNIKRIQNARQVFILFTPMHGCLYIFKSGIADPQQERYLQETMTARRRGKFTGRLALETSQVWPPPPSAPKEH